MRKNKGITLIALVITIIVLLILAGVAIAMLSGENGILKKAAEAKTRTNEGQKQEMSSLLSYEMALNTNNEYKIQDGYITGFEYDETSNRTVKTVKQVENQLPEGYKIITKYNYVTKQDEIIKDEDKANTYIATGMMVQKDGQEVAMTILFGDVDCDGKIDSSDTLEISKFLMSWKINVISQALDINHDGKISKEDENILAQYMAGYSINIEQNAYAISSKELKIRDIDKIAEEYIANDLPDAFKNQTTYKFEYNESSNKYVLKGATTDTLSSSITDLFTDAEITKKDGKNTIRPEKIESGCQLILAIDKEGFDKLTFNIDI